MFYPVVEVAPEPGFPLHLSLHFLHTGHLPLAPPATLPLGWCRPGAPGSAHLPPIRAWPVSWEPKSGQASGWSGVVWGGLGWGHQLVHMKPSLAPPTQCPTHGSSSGHSKWVVLSPSTVSHCLAHSSSPICPRLSNRASSWLYQSVFFTLVICSTIRRLGVHSAVCTVQCTALPCTVLHCTALHDVWSGLSHR